MDNERGRVAIGLFLLGAGMVEACTRTSSADLATDGISAEILVSATSAKGSRVSVEMSPGAVVVPTNTVKLNGSDVLYAEAGGVRERMRAGALDYTAEFRTGAAETPFTVLLARARPDQPDAPGNTGTLPPPFELRDLGGADISQAQDVVLSWAPAGGTDRMALDIRGRCVEDRTIWIDGDPGRYILSRATLEPEHIPSACLVTLTLRRVRNGAVDPHLNPGSRFRLEQVRETTFHSHR